MGVILKPLVTEKLTKLGDKFNRYGFRVQKDANKLQIKQAVETMYNVTVVDVNTMIVPSKKRSRYTKSGVISGKRPAYKKAIVTVKKGEEIDFFSNI
ncbi:MAG TPA: 50S ribosomal protein L23 [Paludibacteraceae bacterium]|jgi:large subunit ribosomal protein L23|nr:50S ribosomal protein L23 [Paludibacteraceae bacterium]HOR38432.1 50S ribosomal protein L23 [Paludibacteraceae bacterium]HPD58551.1 50S ribosomal protein L23 [Paludibacteraceae bacterium]HQF10965.1 50S ribosomal protein L23 [Paludibacteraceae bacterium]HRS23395.1 50S ribosomal protein L23 [Paludibacteraceae bacterium]